MKQEKGRTGKRGKMVSSGETSRELAKSGIKKREKDLEKDEKNTEEQFLVAERCCHMLATVSGQL